MGLPWQGMTLPRFVPNSARRGLPIRRLRSGTILAAIGSGQFFYSLPSRLRKNSIRTPA